MKIVSVRFFAFLIIVFVGTHVIAQGVPEAVKNRSSSNPKRTMFKYEGYYSKVGIKWDFHKTKGHVDYYAVLYNTQTQKTYMFNLTKRNATIPSGDYEVYLHFKLHENTSDQPAHKIRVTLTPKDLNIAEEKLESGSGKWVKVKTLSLDGSTERINEDFRFDITSFKFIPDNTFLATKDGQDRTDKAIKRGKKKAYLTDAKDGVDYVNSSVKDLSFDITLKVEAEVTVDMGPLYNKPVEKDTTKTVKPISDQSDKLYSATPPGANENFRKQIENLLESIQAVNKELSILRQKTNEIEESLKTIDPQEALEKLTVYENAVYDQIRTARGVIQKLDALKESATQVQKDLEIKDATDFFENLDKKSSNVRSSRTNLEKLEQKLTEITSTGTLAKLRKEGIQSLTDAFKNKFNKLWKEQAKPLVSDFTKWRDGYNRLLLGEVRSDGKIKQITETEFKELVDKSLGFKKSYEKLKKEYENLLNKVEKREEMKSKIVSWTSLKELRVLSDTIDHSIQYMEAYAGGDNWMFQEKDMRESLGNKIRKDDFTMPWWGWILILFFVAGFVLFFVYRKKQNQKRKEERMIEFVSKESAKQSKDQKVAEAQQEIDDEDSIEIDVDIDLSQASDPSAEKGVIGLMTAFDTSNLIPVSLDKEWQDTCVSKVWMTKSFVEDIYDYSEESLVQKPAPEVGGFIIGKYHDQSEGQKKNYTIVTEKFIPAKEVDYQDQYEINFGMKAMNELDDALVANPDMVVLGWFHTHPGHTAFLSNADINIHDGSFREPYQVAIVLDPYTEQFDTGIFTRKQNYEMNNKQDSLAYYSWEAFRKVVKENKSTDDVVIQHVSPEGAGQYYDVSHSRTNGKVFFAIEAIMGTKKIYESNSISDKVQALYFGKKNELGTGSVTVARIVDTSNMGPQELQNTIQNNVEDEFVGWLNLTAQENGQPSPAALSNHSVICKGEGEFILTLAPNTTGVNGSIGVNETGNVQLSGNTDLYWIELIKWTRIPRYH